ncbi:MAG: hypothetical protein LBR81_03830 [Prevotellaceae bacterium]|jgi:hypothetical protein|nr:hypothetical protein [Prevotellaceae bacterium]
MPDIKLSGISFYVIHKKATELSLSSLFPSVMTVGCEEERRSNLRKR